MQYTVKMFSTEVGYLAVYCILHDTFFSGKHLQTNNFDNDFKVSIELQEITNSKDYTDNYDCAGIDCDISFEETQAALEYLKPGKAAGPYKVFTDLLLKAEIKQKIQDLENKNISVNISWTPGNANIKGNKEADRLAKEASSEATTMSCETQTVIMQM